jgi:hypothetical protein
LFPPQLEDILEKKKKKSGHRILEDEETEE